MNTYSANTYADADMVATGSFNIPASSISAGSITLTSFTPTSSTNFLVQNTNSEYRITFTPTHQLFSTSRIVITPPALVTSTSCTYQGFSGSAITGTTPVCNKGTTGWVLTGAFDNTDGVASTADYAGGV